MGESLHFGRNPKKSKKLAILCIILAAAVALAVVAGVVVLVRRGGDGGTTSSAPSVSTTPTTDKTLPKSFIARNTASPYVVLANITDGKTLYAKNADAKCYPASLTKLLTAVVAMDYVDADTVITVGNEVYMIDPQSSRAYLAVGTRLTVKQLLQAMLLPSGNDAAYCVAVQVGRRIAGDDNLDRKLALARFCDEMNKKAAALGCTGTHFVNPDGIHDDNHYTTAADMLKIATAALGNSLVAEVVSTPKVTTTLLSGQTVTWHNSNRLVQESGAYAYAGATGLKTGTTDQAGYCLAASATREGKTCVAIVMGATKEENDRWEDAAGLLDISFQ